MLFTENFAIKDVPFEGDTADSNLDVYYKYIGCDCIDIVIPYGLDKEGQEKYCLIVDDEFLFNNPVINYPASILYGSLKHGQPLMGKVLLGKNKMTDDGIITVGLDEEDKRYIHESLRKLVERA